VISRKQHRAGKAVEMMLIGSRQDEVGESDMFTWADGKQVFDTSTKHLRKLLLERRAPSQEPIRVTKWKEQISGVPDTKVITKKIWIPDHEEKVNQFLWQIMHRIPTTRRYIYMHRIVGDIEDGEHIANDDPRMNCLCCNMNVQEDCYHMLWTYHRTAETWLWVENLIRKARNLDSGFKITPAQALLGAPIQLKGQSIPAKLWEVMRGKPVGNYRRHGTRQVTTRWWSLSTR
jgi:hypothetical protein